MEENLMNQVLIPTLFYFSDVTELIGYSEFRVEKSFIGVPCSNSQCATVHNVVGKYLSEESSVVVAEFHCEANAKAFRDLCAMAIR